MISYIDSSKYERQKETSDSVHILSRYVTSFGRRGIAMSIHDNSIIKFESLPSSRIFKDCWVGICDIDGKEYGQSYITPTKEYKLPSLADGQYYLSLHARTLEYPYLSGRDVPIIISSGKYVFKKSEIETHNNKVLMAVSEAMIQHALQPSNYVQSNSLSIKNMAKEIGDGAYTDLEKIERIHAWVANRISYNYDSLDDWSHVNRDNSAIGAYKMGECVCRGYTNLVTALLRASGIPTIVMGVFALGSIKDGGWEIPENRAAGSNHVIPIARLKDRWVIMDTTWDSPNKFKNGSYDDVFGLYYPYKYFDCSLPFISQTHKFVQVYRF